MDKSERQSGLTARWITNRSWFQAEAPAGFAASGTPTGEAQQFRSRLTAPRQLRWNPAGLTLYMLMLDGDAAGQQRTAAIRTLLAPRMAVAVISLQEREQPDQLMARETQRLVQQSQAEAGDAVASSAES